MIEYVNNKNVNILLYVINYYIKFDFDQIVCFVKTFQVCLTLLRKKFQCVLMYTFDSQTNLCVIVHMVFVKRI